MIKKIFKALLIIAVLIVILILAEGLLFYPQELKQEIAGIYEGSFVIDGKNEDVDVIIRSFTTGNGIDIHGDGGKIVLSGDLMFEGRDITIIADDTGETINAKLTKIFQKYIIEGERNDISFKFTMNESGNIIGNPFYHPEIHTLNEETFIDDIIASGAEIGIELYITRLDDEKDEVYKINETFRLYKYSFGFVKLTFKHDNLKEITIETVMIMESLVRTLNPDMNEQELTEMMHSLIGITAVEVKEDKEFVLTWPEHGEYYEMLRYDFSITEEKGYEFHIEDGRMGY